MPQLAVHIISIDRRASRNEEVVEIKYKAHIGMRNETFSCAMAVERPVDGDELAKLVATTIRKHVVEIIRARKREAAYTECVQKLPGSTVVIELPEEI